jgi:hypothetical protein
MKPIFKTSGPAREGEARSSLDHKTQFTSAIDWNFQSSAPNFRGGASYQRLGRIPFPAFRTISNSFFDAEAKREYRIEAAMFGVIVVLAAWPMFQAAHALLDLIK